MGREQKLHIVLLGRRNEGKSSLINALTGQEVAIVSDVAGTTTDLVRRSYEIPGFASVVFTDTAGIDDTGALGKKRVERTLQALPQADLAVLVITRNRFGAEEEQLTERLRRLEIPYLIIHNKSDLEPLSPALEKRLTAQYGVPVIDFSVTRGDDPETILEEIRRVGAARAPGHRSLLGDRVRPGQLVLLVTPIDSEAPVGRMILPQVQVLRDLLDNHCLAATVQPEEIPAFLRRCAAEPDLVVTDSQVFHRVDGLIPAHIPLTSFSIVLARHKGAFEAYLQGTPHIGQLRAGDRVLILESCSHHVSCEDIGRHKLPALLRKKSGESLQFDFVPGLDAIPRPITEYALVIQCGGCMITEKQLKNRLLPAIEAGIPVSNYGMAIAWLHGIFKRAVAPFTTATTESSER